MAISPPSQSGKNISLLLSDRESGRIIKSVTLPIRPEDLSFNAPSRTSVNHTIGGSWVDDFGPGIVRISISGTTGWRGGEVSAPELMGDLAAVVRDRWHELRQWNVSVGKNPDFIQLLYTDDLNIGGLSYVVTPENVVIRRNKQRPLLYQYQISLVVVSSVSIFESKFNYTYSSPVNSYSRLSVSGGSGYSSYGGSNDSGASTFAKEATQSEEYSLNTSINDAVADLYEAVNDGLCSSLEEHGVVGVTSFVQGSAEFFEVVAEKGLTTEIADETLYEVVAVSETGVNLFRTIDHLVDLAVSEIPGRIHKIISVYRNVLCSYVKILSQLQSAWRDGAWFLKSSGCAQHSRSAFSEDNPFFWNDSISGSAVIISLAAIDLSSVSLDDLGNYIERANSSIDFISSSGSSSGDAPNARTLSGFRHAETLHGETIQEFALRETGDANNWTLIADINGLRPPYFTSESALTGDGVVLYGASIIVPAATQMATSTDPNRLFEADLLLTDGLLSFDDNDLSTVSGVANLTQSLRHALDTRSSEIIRHPEYGCRVYELLGVKGIDVSSALGREFVSGTLLRDERVERVSDASASLSGDTLRIVAKANPITGRPINLDTGVA